MFPRITPHSAAAMTSLPPTTSSTTSIDATPPRGFQPYRAGEDLRFPPHFPTAPATVPAPGIPATDPMAAYSAAYQHALAAAAAATSHHHFAQHGFR